MIEVFRCDYCGQLTPLENARIWWALAEDMTTDEGHVRYSPAVFCSDYCGRSHTTAAGSGRG